MVTIRLKNGKVRKMPVDEAIKKGYPVPPPPPAPAPPAPPATPAGEPNLLKRSSSSLNFEDGKEPLLIYAELVISQEQMNEINPENIQSIEVLKGEKAIAAYGEKGKNGVIKITPKTSLNTQPLIKNQDPGEVVVIGYSTKPKAEAGTLNSIVLKNADNQPLYVLNGQVITIQEASDILSSGVESINVLKDKTAAEKYGDKGKNGVIEIITKANPPITGTQPNTYDKVFTKMEKAPAYPGGSEAWTKYLQKNLRYPDEAFDLQIEGKVEVQFVVSKTGKIGDIKVVQSPHISLSKEAMRLISAGGNWIPGQQNNLLVNARVTQSIQFMQDYPEKKPEIVKQLH